MSVFPYSLMGLGSDVIDPWKSKSSLFSDSFEFINRNTTKDWPPICPAAEDVLKVRKRARSGIHTIKYHT